MSASGAIIIAGWDAWDSASSPTATVTAAGVTATAAASAAGSSNWSFTEGSGRGSSKDTTWGTFDGNGNAASPTTAGSGLNFTATNGVTDAQITFTITNSGSVALDLETFHMDALAFRPNAPRTYALNVLSGDITNGIVFTSADDAITHLGGGLKTDDLDPETHDQHDDIDLDLAFLADHTLDAGESAVIQLAFSSGTGSGGGHHLFLDNVAVSGVPEPASLLLSALGLGLLGFRRKR
jgi:hypothetical protein